MLARASEDRAVALVHVARDGQRSRAFMEMLAFAAPDIEALESSLEQVRDRRPAEPLRFE